MTKLKIIRKSKEKKLIIEDVNKKTVDHLMTGIEAIVGHYSRNTYIQKIDAFDNHYIKKLLMSKRAMDIMTLKLQRITLDEHYARLYGPAVLISRDDAGSVVEKASTSDMEAAQIQEDERRKTAKLDQKQSLRLALRSTSYERYRNRFLREDFQESVLGQLENRAKHAGLIARSMASPRPMSAGPEPLRRRVRGAFSECLDDDAEEIDRFDEGASFGKDATVEEESAELLPVGYRHRRYTSVSRPMTANEIRKQYLEAKNRFKSLDIQQSLKDEKEDAV